MLLVEWCRTLTLPLIKMSLSLQTTPKCMMSSPTHGAIIRFYRLKLQPLGLQFTTTKLFFLVELPELDGMLCRMTSMDTIQ